MHRACPRPRCRRPLLRLGPVVEMTAHPVREVREVVQSLVEHAVDDLEVDIQVTVHDHVPETGHAAKPVCEAGGKDAHLGQVVDGSGGVWLRTTRSTASLPSAVASAAVSSAA